MWPGGFASLRTRWPCVPWLARCGKGSSENRVIGVVLGRSPRHCRARRCPRLPRITASRVRPAPRTGFSGSRSRPVQWSCVGFSCLLQILAEAVQRPAGRGLDVPETFLNRPIFVYDSAGGIVHKNWTVEEGLGYIEASSSRPLDGLSQYLEQ